MFESIVALAFVVGLIIGFIGALHLPIIAITSDVLDNCAAPPARPLLGPGGLVY